jgi:NitT/TauT family transport system substrate-binding protein
VGIAYGTTVSLIQKRHPGVRVLFDLRSAEDRNKFLGFDEIAHSVLITRGDWIRDNAEIAGKLARATVRASEWARTHSPEEIRARLPESLRTEQADVDADAIRWTVQMLSPDGRFRPEHLDAALRILSASGPGEAGRVEPSSVYTNEFVSSQRP